MRPLLICCTLALSILWPATTSAQTLVPFSWDGVDGHCFFSPGGNPRGDEPFWEQAIPLRVQTKNLPGVGTTSYTCDFGDDGDTPAPQMRGNPGALVETMSLNGVAFNCTWNGNIGDLSTDRGPSNLSIQKVTGLITEGYTCVRA